MEAIGALAAGIAHEINTPMQFISDNTNFIKESFESFSEYLMELNLKLLEDENITIEELQEFNKQKEEELDLNFLMEEIPEAIGQTIEGIERVTKIIKSMKEFSHPSSKDKVLTDLNKNIENTVTITKNEWKYAAEVEMNLSSELPLVKCLPDEINQVLLNITVNAAQAIEEKLGKHPESKGKISFSTFVEGDFAVITIEDSGIGIPKENLQKIFDPFFTTKDIGRGTGQGLAIAMDIIVNKHGGILDVESEPNVGSKFTIKLPIGGSE
jgi:signal transduction histidine kinase